MNILIYYANQQAAQSVLKEKYNSSFQLGAEPNPKEFIKYIESTNFYDFIVIAKYPHVYARNGNKSVVTFKVTQEQHDFIASMPNVIEILAECDNDPNTDYIWQGAGQSSINKFKTVVRQDFFDGNGDPGDSDYIAPRKKLAVLA